MQTGQESSSQRLEKWGVGIVCLLTYVDIQDGLSGTAFSLELTRPRTLLRESSVINLGGETIMQTGSSLTALHSIQGSDTQVASDRDPCL